MNTDPYNPEKYGGIQLPVPSAPPPAGDSIPLDAAETASEDRPARVRMRIKGNDDGPVFEGQTIIVPCINCGRK